jgi:outer membrane lipoprotein-sorting protein
MTILTTVARRCISVCLILSSGAVAGAELPASSSTAPATAAAATSDARELVAAVIDQTRGTTSHGRLEMRIHRPTWERTSTLEAWTRGREDALIRFVAPARDAGNATLKQGEQMWTYTPKLNRTIRLPFSLMSQSWGGSDFSYNDLSRTDQLLQFYDLELVATEQKDGHTVHTVRATPHADAPVVWGREELVFRDDHVLLSHTFFDQDLAPLKRLEALEVGELGGRALPIRMRMSELDTPEHYTEIVYLALTFDVPLDDSMFTLFALQRGGPG